MNRRTAYSFVALAALAGLALIAYFSSRAPSQAQPELAVERGSNTTRRHAFAGSVGDLNSDSFPLAARLNAPGATLAQDLDVVRQILEAWRSNFPREGNPVGDNLEITAALLGENRLGVALVPRHHPAVSAAGELCDRWGTPFRFHAQSGERMEVRSAGPDRKFGTGDDGIWSP